MAVVQELIRKEADGTISFGDYTLETKSKVEDFQYNGDLYKVKTYKKITKLEKNGMFVYESVPGTSVFNMDVTGSGMSFQVDGKGDAQFTVELEDNSCYNITIDEESHGVMETKVGGKLSVGVELGEKPVAVKIFRCE